MSELFFDVQQKTDKQHILDNPDTYIGSVEQIDSDYLELNNIPNDKFPSDHMFLVESLQYQAAAAFALVFRAFDVLYDYCFRAEFF